MKKINIVLLIILIVFVVIIFLLFNKQKTSKKSLNTKFTQLYNVNKENIGEYKLENKVLRKLYLDINNLTCASCRQNIIQSLKGVRGIISSDVDLKTQLGWVIYSPAYITKEDIIGLPIFKIYPAKIIKDEEYNKDF